MKIYYYFFCVILSCLFLGCSMKPDRAFLEESFQNPPESTRPAIYWYWMNEHVSKEGITKDLEAMARVGIGEVFIGNIYEGGTPGKLKTLSSEWKECMQHAIKEGTRLGIDISLFNSPGWSQSGGPWVKPEQSMRYLTYVAATVKGGKLIQEVLQPSDTTFQDVAVLAYPKINDICLKPQSVYSNCKSTSLNSLFDVDLKSQCRFDNRRLDSLVIDIVAEDSFAARSLLVYPTGKGFNTTCKLLKKSGNEFKMVKQLFFDRSNTSLQLGPTPDGPLAMAFPREVAKEFRVVLTNLPENFELREISLSSAVKLEKFTEKWLNKLPNVTTPQWNTHVWDSNAQSNQVDFVTEKDVIDISSFLNNNVLTWNAPEGEWNILRIGMVPTRTTNVPAAPVATGLEIDKMNKNVCQAHFDAYVGDIMDGLSKDELRSLKKLIVDSYEVGPQNWTDNFRDIFRASMGYDPLPWLPVLTGDVIGSEEESNRFLWDMRRTIANQIAEQYVGGLKEVAHKHGLDLWLENYGHWGYPSEFLYYGSFSDYVGGEFWANSGPSPECKLASSSCHIYGKNKVYAESYTAGGKYFERTPRDLKQKGDWSYTQGINQVVMHVYIHQPYEDKTPGINAWFGIEYNRKNTWFEQSKSWIDYQRRCSFMLQQGLPVNDVCIFIGEDAPSMDGWKDKSMSSGYSFDFINSDVILNRLTVNDGKLCLPEGVEYSVMLLPPLSTMRPEVLRKIEELISEGAVIVGNPPVKSPSLSGYPECDEVVKSIAHKIWGTLDVSNQKPIVRKVGKGKVYCNVPVNDVLREEGVVEDLKSDVETLHWTHRKLEHGDIYFLTNQGQEKIQTTIEFRVKNKLPELWNALDGSNRKLASFQSNETSTKVPVVLDVNESCFIVFLDDGKSQNGILAFDMNYPQKNVVQKIQGPWNIHFVNKDLKQDFMVCTDSLFDWSKSEDDRIKYFSGTAVYSTSFTLSDKDLSEDEYYLSIDTLHSIGKVRLNNEDVETLWTPPYRVNISPYLREGDNKLEIAVTNTWVNQLVYQSSYSVEKRDTWTLIDVIKPDHPLMPSGIVGEISIIKSLNK